MKQEKWLLCPVCGNKTRLKLREDTRARRKDAEPINL